MKFFNKFLTKKSLFNLLILFLLTLQIFLYQKFSYRFLDTHDYLSDESLIENVYNYQLYFFVSTFFLIIGSILYFTNSRKFRYFFGGSLIGGIAAIFYVNSPLAIACIIPIFGACIISYFSSKEKVIAPFLSFVVILLGIATTIYWGYAPDRMAQLEKLKAIELVKDKLTDPESGKFRKLYAPLKNAKFVCGEVNAKNVFGAYTGFRKFTVANENVVILDQEQSDFYSEVEADRTKRTNPSIRKFSFYGDEEFLCRLMIIQTNPNFKFHDAGDGIFGSKK